MREYAPFDGTLIELRQAFADLGTLLGVIDHLRSRADRLLPPLLGEFRALRPILDRAIVLLEQALEPDAEENGT